MPGTLVLEPLYGLGNRLEAIVSSCVLAEQAGARLRLRWHAHPTECNALWRDLFEPSDVVEVEEDSPSAPVAALRATPAAFQPAAAVERLRAGATVEVRAYYRFRTPDLGEARFLERAAALAARLQPVRAVRERIPPVDRTCLGLHVRGTDHWVSLRHAPPRLFLDQVRGERAGHPTAPVFLAADSADVRARFAEALGARLVTTPAPELRRNRAGAVPAALADLLTLARCGRVLCPPNSSFAPCARHFGAPRPEVVTLDGRPWTWPGSWKDRFPQLLLVYDQDRQAWRRKPLYGKHRVLLPLGWLALAWARRLAGDTHRWGRGAAAFRSFPPGPGPSSA